MRILLILLTIATSISLKSQHFESGYIFPSDYKENSSNKIGKGGLQYLSGSYTHNISTNVDSLGQVNMWSATFSGKYASLDNKDGAKAINPREIINAGAMLTHIHSINRKWNIIATAGLSLNATPDYIRYQSLSITGGIIFMYNINRNLNIGIGAVTTTAYGEPVIIPAPFITWKKEGKYNIELNMRGVPEFTISTQINEKTKITFAPFDMDRYSAVIKVNNDHKLYTQNIFKSRIGASYRFSRHWSAEANIGYIYYRTTRIQERSFKSFWKDLFDNDKRHKFSPSGIISIGLRYHIK